MNHQIRVTAEAAVQNEDALRALITRCALQVLESEGIDFDCFIDVTIVDGETIRAMNAEYRDKDAVTDVLSFPQFDDWDDLPEEGEIVLGDVVICMERAAEQAEEFGHSLEREVLYLFVHSIYHLLGYDHMEEDEKREMREKEEAVMTELGLTRD